MAQLKQFTKKQSIRQMAKLLQTRRNLVAKDFKVGNLLIMRYYAKDTKQIFDVQPLVLILKINDSHMLGLNFHWIPFKMRIWLIRYIIKINKERIRQKKRLNFDYKKVRPLLKKLKYAPCIRLYIKKRIGKTGVVIQPERLIEVAPLRTELFTSGLSAEKLYQLAIRKKI